MKYVAYYRVSTRKQGESGLGLSAQKAIVSHYIKPEDLAAEYTEVASAKSIDKRPLLQKAIYECISGDQTLVVATIDRLSRKTEDALAIYDKLSKNLVSCDIPNLDKFTLTIFMAIADRERELISIRTKAALIQKREKDGEWRISQLSDNGRNLGAVTNHETAVSDYKQISGYVTMMHNSGMSLRAIANRLNEEGHKTRKGKTFQAITVKRILDRIDFVLS